MLAAQVLLDRARFSPGVIDGLGGANVSQAERAFREAHGLPASDSVDAQMIAKLQEVSPGPVLVKHQVTEAELGRPYLPSIPGDLAAQAELEHLGYTSALEALAERFHMSEDLLRALNPDVELDKGACVQTPVAAMPGERVKITSGTLNTEPDRADLLGRGRTGGCRFRLKHASDSAVAGALGANDCGRSLNGESAAVRSYVQGLILHEEQTMKICANSRRKVSDIMDLQSSA